MKRADHVTSPVGLLLRRFRRDARGVTAIEFAMLALPFFSILFATIETLAVFYASVSLETAAADVGRLVRTGQAQTQGLTREQIRNRVCGIIFMGCDDRLQIDVRQFNNFQNVSFNNPLNGDGDLRTDLLFQPGNPGDIVLVRLFYAWDISTPLIGAALSNMLGDKHLVVASVAFRNEPYNNPAAQQGGGG